MPLTKPAAPTPAETALAVREHLYNTLNDACGASQRRHTANVSFSNLADCSPDRYEQSLRDLERLCMRPPSPATHTWLREKLSPAPLPGISLEPDLFFMASWATPLSHTQIDVPAEQDDTAFVQRAATGLVQLKVLREVPQAEQKRRLQMFALIWERDPVPKDLQLCVLFQVLTTEARISCAALARSYLAVERMCRRHNVTEPAVRRVVHLLHNQAVRQDLLPLWHSCAEAFVAACQPGQPQPSFATLWSSRPLEILQKILSDTPTAQVSLVLQLQKQPLPEPMTADQASLITWLWQTPTRIRPALLRVIARQPDKSFAALYAPLVRATTVLRMGEAEFALFHMGPGQAPYTRRITEMLAAASPKKLTHFEVLQTFWPLALEKNLHPSVAMRIWRAIQSFDENLPPTSLLAILNTLAGRVGYTHDWLPNDAFVVLLELVARAPHLPEPVVALSVIVDALFGPDSGSPKTGPQTFAEQRRTFSDLLHASDSAADCADLCLTSGLFITGMTSVVGARHVLLAVLAASPAQRFSWAAQLLRVQQSWWDWNSLKRLAWLTERVGLDYNLDADAEPFCGACSAETRANRQRLALLRLDALQRKYDFVAQTDLPPELLANIERWSQQLEHSAQAKEPNLQAAYGVLLTANAQLQEARMNCLAANASQRVESRVLQLLHLCWQVLSHKRGHDALPHAVADACQDSAILGFLTVTAQPVPRARRRATADISRYERRLLQYAWQMDASVPTDA